MADYVNHNRLSMLIHEQDFMKQYPFTVSIQNGDEVNGIELMAMNEAYARMMAECQLTPGDCIISVHRKTARR